MLIGEMPLHVVKRPVFFRRPAMSPIERIQRVLMQLSGEGEIEYKIIANKLHDDSPERWVIIVEEVD